MQKFLDFRLLPVAEGFLVFIASFFILIASFCFSDDAFI